MLKAFTLYIFSLKSTMNSYIKNIQFLLRILLLLSLLGAYKVLKGAAQKHGSYVFDRHHLSLYR